MSDDEHDNGEEGDFADWNEEEDEGQRRARCLFSSRTHPSPTAALAHAADAFGFDLRELTARYGLDFYGTIMALNYARTVAKDRGASASTDDAESKVAAERAIEGIAAGEHRDGWRDGHRGDHGVRAARKPPLFCTLVGEAPAAR